MNMESDFTSIFQPRSQGLRGETVTKTLVKFVLSFQNFGEKIACAVRHNRIAITVEYGCVSLRMRFFSQNFGTIKRILPGSSSPSHREGLGTEVGIFLTHRKERFKTISLIKQPLKIIKTTFRASLT